MADSEKPCGNYPVVFCKVAIGFITLSYTLVMHMIDIISRHIVVAFNIPTHNIGIYYNKLYSLRCLTFVISYLVENCIFQVAGGDRDPKESTKVRRYVAVFAFSALLFARCVYLFLLYSSSHLAYHIYIILVLEGFCFGFHDSSFMALASEFISIVSIMYGLCRIFISGCQHVLDAFWFNRPLLIIKIQGWICVTCTAIGVGLWYHYNLNIKGRHLDQHVEQKVDNKPSEENIESVDQPQEETKVNTCVGFCKECAENLGNDGVGAALSPVLMYWATTMFRDFTFPATLPYGLLPRDKCHIINVMIPYFLNLGPTVFFLLDNFTDVFVCWSWYLDLFWLLFIPMPILLTYTLRAMVTRDRGARAIINCKARVTCMSFMLMLSFGFNEPLSYIGVAKYAFRQNPGGFTLMGFHLCSALLCRSIFSKIAVGFGDTRNSLGYHLPKFRPNHRMSRKNLYMYLFRQTFRRAWKDAKGDLRLDIKKYL